MPEKITQEQIEELKQIDTSIKESVKKIQEFEEKYGKIDVAKLIGEKKTLSDEVQYPEDIPSGVEIVRVDKARTKINELIEWCNRYPKVNYNQRKTKAKEILGDKFIK